MNCINDHIYITFDQDDRFKKILPGGAEIIMPKVWDYVDDYGQKNGKWDTNLNGLEANPQVGYVLVENPAYRFKSGDKIFMHFLAYENRWRVSIGDYDGYAISANDIFFTDNGTIEMVDGVYLGKQLYDDIPQTPSGLYIGHVERKKECYIELTHVPLRSPYKPGNIIFTVDGAQYPVRYNGMELIKVLENEIVGVVQEDVVCQ